MSPRRRAGGPPSAPSPERSAESGLAGPRRAPRLLHYVYLNLAVWTFLGLQAAVLVRSLGSSQTVLLFTVVLGLGFLAVSVFDYVWLRLRG